MINGDPKPLPATIPGLFESAFNLYIRRFGLYAVLALIALVVQFAVGVVLPHTEGLVTGLGIIVDAFLVAAVTIGVAFDVAHKPADWHAVLEAASLRWGVVTVVGFAYFLLVYSLAPNVAGNPSDTGYGFFILPIITLWGAVSLSQVVASIEPAKSRLILPFIALGRALSVSLSAPNIGRLVVLSAILVLPYLLANVLYDQFRRHGFHDAMFYANVPLDALVTGPLQALSTVFYVDFLRRAKR